MTLLGRKRPSPVIGEKLDTSTRRKREKKGDGKMTPKPNTIVIP